jgi:hypothetical protein
MHRPSPESDNRCRRAMKILAEGIGDRTFSQVQESSFVVVAVPGTYLSSHTVSMAFRPHPLTQK